MLDLCQCNYIIHNKNIFYVENTIGPEACFIFSLLRVIWRNWGIRPSMYSLYATMDSTEVQEIIQGKSQHLLSTQFHTNSAWVFVYFFRWYCRLRWRNRRRNDEKQSKIVINVYYSKPCERIWLKISTQVHTDSGWFLVYFFGGTTASAGGTAAIIRKNSE